MSRRLLAIGDIHGCLDPFRELVEGKIRLKREDRLVLLGDYIDRGTRIREVIDYIIDLRKQGFDIVPLKGNHEAMLIDSIKSEKLLHNWFMNGGYDTLASFGIDSVNELEARYVEFFTNLQYYYTIDSFIFVHAGFNDECADPFEDRIQMVWSRRESYSNPVFEGKTIVHGHTPIPLQVCREELMSGNRVINIDTGCVYDKSGGYGHLTGIELYTMELFTV
jgi:serine/threonine protein phosphatase 1